jgi:hypothetical protein
MASVTTSSKSTGPQKDVLESAANGMHRLPPLEAGDSLSRDEFERRYEATPELKKAELIERAVVVPSPVRHATASVRMAIGVHRVTNYGRTCYRFFVASSGCAPI